MIRALWLRFTDKIDAPLFALAFGSLLGTFYLGKKIKQDYWKLMAGVGFIILAILLVAFFTPQIGRASALIEKKFWTTFGWGILAPFLFVIVLIGLVFSIIGILLLPLAFLVFLAACVFGYVAVAHLCGKKLLVALRLRGKPMMAEVIVGLILLWLISTIPMIGGVINAVVGICGFGAVAVSRFGTK